MMISSAPCQLTGQPPHRMAYLRVDYELIDASEHSYLPTQTNILCSDVSQNVKMKEKSNRVEQKLSFVKRHCVLEIQTLSWYPCVGKRSRLPWLYS